MVIIDKIKNESERFFDSFGQKKATAKVNIFLH
jgi:hypothetical protein